MSYALAIDVGTSFTAAAVVRFHPGASPVPECLPLGTRGTSVPSVIYYPEAGAVLVGEAAERRALDSPERVAREFKRRIGDDVPIVLGTLALQPEDVFATMARWVADRAAEREGEPASAVFLTHPAAWGPHRLAVVLAALAARGLENVTPVPEPEAAALHYAAQVRVEEGSTIAVYDLGGGTFDTAVLRKSGTSRFELLGRPDGIEDLGGADFDAAVFRYVAGHTGNALDGLDPADPAVVGSLARLKRECVEAKEALSADSEAGIPVLLPGVQQQVRLVRSEFESLIEEPVRETVEALERSLARLHLEPADLSTVLLIGGSSRIPLVAQIVSEELDRPIAVDADPKSSICLGAAVAAVLAHTAEEAAAATEPAGTAAEDDEARAAVVPPSAATSAPRTRIPGVPAMPGRPGRRTTAAGASSASGALRARHGGRGAHAPTPSARVTAVAAAAAVLTVLTATAAQSPDGFGSLTAMFVPRAGASTTGGSAGTGGTQAAGGGDATAIAVPQLLAGVEASARKPFSAAPLPEAPTSERPAATGAPVAAAGAPVPTASSGPNAAPAGVAPEAATVDPAPAAGTPAPTTEVPAPTATALPDSTPTETTPPASPSVPAEVPTPVSGTATPGTPGTTPPAPSGSTPPATESATSAPTTMAASGPPAQTATPTGEITATPTVASLPAPRNPTATAPETAVTTATSTSPEA
ncbi:MAG: Hsp70 family protein [Actinomycetes bacterium]